MKKIWILSALLLSGVVNAQQTISLDECMDLATENYPLAKQSILLHDQNQLDIEAINKGKLPKMDVNAQATYQSDVVSLPIQIPNTTIDPPNKDQYRVTLDVNQSIYNGGLLNVSAKLAQAKGKVARQELEVSLYTLKNQVSQLYLSVLLLQKNRSLLEVKQKQLIARLEEVASGIKFGILLPSSGDALEVELLKVQQDFAELDFSKVGLLKRLSLLTGRELSKDVTLQSPEVFLVSGTESKRPELMLFQLQKEQVAFSTELLSRSKLPKLSAFVQGGYGNPGLNMLDNSFNSFYMTGLRLNWNVFDWSKNKTEKLSLEINKEIIDTQKNTFELNTQVELASVQSDIDKIEELISYDEAIIPLRERMMKTAESQLGNGVITSSTYIEEVTNLFEAKNNLALHKTQLLLKQIQYQIVKGTYGK